MTFSEDFFIALNNWQNGWNENQETRELLSKKLEIECKHLDDKYKVVNASCFRKRYIHRGELVDIILNNNKNEGITSWTTDFKYAELFKGKYRDDAVTAAIFEYQPLPQDVILNVNELWKCNDFKEQITKQHATNPDSCNAIMNFKDYQSEVILNVPLRGSDIIALTGKSSDFDDLCNYANIPMSNRPAYFRQLIKEGYRIEEYTYVNKEEAKRAIANTIKLFILKLEALKK